MRTRAGERIRRGSGAAALLGAGALVLSGCAGVFVPAGEGEPSPTPTATRAPASSGGPVAAETLDPSAVPYGDIAPPSPTPTAAPAPTPTGDCPASGVRVDMGPVETAMFARAVVLTLVNCGTDPYQVDGYPSVRVLDENGDRLPVPVNPGRSMFGADLGPESVALKPGGTMKSVLAWVSTKEGGDLIESDSLELAAAPDTGSRNVPLVGHDLRLMDELNMTAWRTKLPG